MQGELRYVISEELKLVLVHYSGVLNIGELVSQVTVRNQDPSYDPSFHVIYDFRDCIFDIKLSDFEVCIDEAKQNPVYRVENRVAVLVNKPKETILTMSFIASVRQYTASNFEVFYALGVALQFVDVSLTEKRRVEHMFKKLREGR